MGEIDLAAALGEAFDVVHDHSGFTALAMADRVSAPVVHTVRGQFDQTTNHFYERHGHKARLLAISRSQAASAPAGVTVADVVPNPIVVDRWPLVFHKHEYLPLVGRMDPVNGVHRAIEAAGITGRPLVLAGPVQTGQEVSWSSLTSTDAGCASCGELGGSAVKGLFANAAALLMPVRWREPFGMVMVGALACGTPVIAFPEGAAAEIVIDGENAMLVADVAEMAGAVERLGSIDPQRCARASRSATTSRLPSRDTSASTAERSPPIVPATPGTASNGVPLRNAPLSVN